MLVDTDEMIRDPKTIADWLHKTRKKDQNIITVIHADSRCYPSRRFSMNCSSNRPPFT